jgi:hypothetical protein
MELGQKLAQQQALVLAVLMLQVTLSKMGL